MLAKRDPETTTVGEVMTEGGTALTGEHSYGDALRLMVEHNYTYLPIVDDTGTLAGILSLRGLLDPRRHPERAAAHVTREASLTCCTIPS